MITDHGKFEGCPDHARYMWELVVDGGIGIDTMKSETDNIHTWIQVAPEDVKLFPDLKVQEWWELWEDDQGFVHCEHRGSTGPNEEDMV